MAAGFAALQETSAAGIDAGLAAGMPTGMTMADGEHCAYCPPDAAGGGADVAGACSYPHDPQVDLRLGLAAVLLAPPPVTLLVVTADGAARITGASVACAAPPAPHAPLNLSFCRFLE
jgi:hypothetical protein